MMNRTEELEMAIRKHRAATGHERCLENDLELYRVLNEPLPEPSLPPREEFLGRCAEYWKECSSKK